MTFIDPIPNRLRADPSSTAYDGRGCACDDEHRGGDFCSRCGAATRVHVVSTAVDQHGYAPQVYTRPRNRHERRAAAARARR